MVEIKTQLEELEKLIDNRVEKQVTTNVNNSLEIKKYDRETSTVKVKKKTLIERLEKIKKTINARHEKSLKVWEKAVEVYSEIMKKQLGSRSLKFPDKPKLPEAYEVICGYIDLFSSIMNDELQLKMEYLEGIFLDTKSSINSQKQDYYNLCAYTSGSVYAMSDSANASWNDTSNLTTSS